MKKALLFIMVIALVLTPAVVKAYFYEVFLSLSRINVLIRTHNWNTVENQNFFVRYRDGEKENALLVLKTSELYYDGLCEKYNINIKEKIPVILYPSKKEMNSTFGWPASEGAMGVYWGGVIRILSPDEWINYETSREKESVFATRGPVAHELTHLLVDYKCKGNYPRWFTEGMAQYEEYKLTGFRFKSPGREINNYYSFDMINSSFETLPDPVLAYRQSMAMVEYIAEVYGEDKLHIIIKELAGGQPVFKAIKEVTGLSPEEYEEKFLNWHQYR